ncbi:hypothetical protein K435DRAFT_874482, partial [Dendrothele bispora CBS 962.96]
MPPRKTQTAQRSWERSFFQDHPNWERWASGDTSGIYNPGVAKDSQRPKVFCRECLRTEISIIIGQDAQKVDNGLMETARTTEQIEAKIWARPVLSGHTRGRTILRPAGSTLLNHLKSCEYQTEETRQMAISLSAAAQHSSSQPRTPPQKCSSMPSSHIVGISHSSSNLGVQSSAPPSVVQGLSNSNVVSLNSPLIAPISDENQMYPTHLDHDDAISSISGVQSSISPSDSASAELSRPRSRQYHALSRVSSFQVPLWTDE